MSDIVFSFGIPIFNGAQYLRNLLSSIELSMKEATFSYEIVVVDDGSTEDIKSVISDFKNLPIVFEVFSENKGSSFALNRIIELMRGEFLFKLDADTIVNQKAVTGLLEYMQNNPNVGAVAPKLIGPHGDNQSTVEMSFKEPYEWVSDYALWLKKIFRKKINVLDTLRIPTQIAYCGTGAVMIRKEVIERIGLLDTTIQFFMEDADYIWRITETSWKVMYHPDFQILHVGGHSGILYIHMRPISLTNLHKFYKKYRPGKFNLAILDISILVGTSISVGLLLPALPLWFSPKFRIIISRAGRSYFSVYQWYWKNLFQHT